MVTATERPQITPEQALERRKAKAEEILLYGEIHAGSNGAYWVQAQSEPRKWYRVHLDPNSCTCADELGREKLGVCKHILALQSYLGIDEPTEQISLTEKGLQAVEEIEKAQTAAQPAPAVQDKLEKAVKFIANVVASDIALDWEAEGMLNAAKRLIAEALSEIRSTPEPTLYDELASVYFPEGWC